MMGVVSRQMSEATTSPRQEGTETRATEEKKSKFGVLLLVGGEVRVIVGEWRREGEIKQERDVQSSKTALGRLKSRRNPGSKPWPTSCEALGEVGLAGMGDEVREEFDELPRAAGAGSEVPILRFRRVPSGEELWRSSCATTTGTGYKTATDTI